MFKSMCAGPRWPAWMCGALTLVFAGPPALAQQPGGGQSGTIEGQIRRPDLPAGTVPTFAIEKPLAGAAASGVRFWVRSIEVAGVTVIDKAAVDAAVTPFTGREVTLAELSGAADAITALYTNTGYALSFALIPEQTVRDGVVRIVVVEGRIDKVSVIVTGRGALVPSDRLESALEARLRTLAHGRPVKVVELEQAIFGIADLSGLSPSVVVRPSESVEGAADLVVELAADPIAANLSVDNRLRSEFGDEAATGGVTVNSLLTVGDALSVTSRYGLKDGAYEFYSARYESSIGATAVRAYGSVSHAETTAVSGLLGALDFEGEETAYRVGARYPLIRSRTKNLYLQGELFGVDSTSRALGVVLIEDKVRTAEIALTADWTGWRRAPSMARVGIVRGLDGLGATPAGNPLASRFVGEPEFTALTASYLRDQPIADGWRVRLDVDGQAVVAGTPLAPSECSYGGEQFGRAYTPGVVGAPNCLRGSLEVGKAFPIGPRMAVAPYAYVDGAQVSRNGPLAVGEERNTSAASAGFGVRAILPRSVVLDILATKPFDPAFAERGKDVRYYVSLGIRL